MKQYKLILLLLFLWQHSAWAQISHNRDYVVCQSGPALTLNPISNPNCNCTQSTSCTRYQYYSAAIPIFNATLNCNFLGEKIVSEQRLTETYIPTCRVQDSRTETTGTFKVTGVEYKWTGSIDPQCKVSTGVRLSSYISHADGTTFSGPGVSDGMFYPQTAGSGTWTITASKTFDNGPVSRTISIHVYAGINLVTIPTDKTICPGASTTYAVSAIGGNPPEQYQWQYSADGSNYTDVSDGAVYAGSATTTLTVTSPPASWDGYIFRARIMDRCGSATQATSTTGELNFHRLVSIIEHPTSKSVCAGALATFRVVAGGSDLSYRWQTSTNGQDWTDLADDAVYTGTTTATLNLVGATSAHNGRRYRVTITGACDLQQSNAATLTLTPGPSITSPSAASTFCEGTAASFSVAVSGSSLTYQWQFSSTGLSGAYGDLAGATGAAWSTNAVTLAQAGHYRVVVKNSCGGAGTTSAAAQLVVNPATKFTTQPGDKTACAGTSVQLTAAATGMGTISYQWELSTNGGSSFVTIPVSAAYNGTITPMLSITEPGAGMNNFRYRVKATGACGSATSSAAVLSVSPIPSAPTVTNPARCGNGPLSAAASSTAASPTFRWFVNAGDASPLYTGATYQVSNLTASAEYYVSVTASGCESTRRAVSFTHKNIRPVPLGDPLSLCVGQGVYNLESDIADPAAIGSNFAWTANGVSYSARMFDPAVVGAGSFPVAYDPPASAKAYPYCYMVGSRTVHVLTSAGGGGITFEHQEITGGDIMNLCVGDAPIDIAPVPSIPGGNWSTVRGAGLSYNGNAVVFTPNAKTYTEVEPNIFRYTVDVIGCAASRDLNIYVKDNPNKPVITGLPSVVCPSERLNLVASVDTPGSFSFAWYKAGQTQPFYTGATLDYTVERQETLQLRSIDGAFGCPSLATLVEIATPFRTGTISAAKRDINPADFVTFTTDALESGNTFSWNFGDGASSSESRPTHYFYTPGAYIVRLNIVSNRGCAQTIFFDKVTVNGEPVEIITGSSADLKQESVRVYPNPLNGRVHISNAQVRRLSLINQRGDIIPLQVRKEGAALVLDADDLKPGVYILTLWLDTGIQQIKLIQQ